MSPFVRNIEPIRTYLRHSLGRCLLFVALSPRLAVDAGFILRPPVGSPKAWPFRCLFAFQFGR